MFLSPALLVCLIAPDWQPAPVDPTVYTVQQRAFRVPVQIESRRGEIEQIALFVSTDQGKAWRETGVISADEDSFRYVAPNDGVYWFAVQIVLKNKTKEPAEPKLLEPALRVAVETPKKPEWQPVLAEINEELKLLRAEVKKLKEHVSVLEKQVKEKP